uniref:Replication-associated protein n=1 Tax=Grus japonensis CRESS-DNA-virus sp. TaxID=2815045 RepID=A0A8A4XCU9_9VIRU|nr:MAG: replication protein [Grus japonensis CRESS-DNA-virus sp.]
MTSKCRAYSLRITLAQHEQAAWLPLMRAAVDANKFNRLLIGGPEIGPEKGIRHVHAYVEFANQASVSAMEKALRLTGLVHWQQPAAKSDFGRIRDHHCKPESKEDPNVLCLLEHPTFTTLDKPTSNGIKPTALKVTDRIQQIIETGGSVEQVKAENYGWYATHSGFVEREVLKYREPVSPTKYDHLWIHGAPGTGKSSSCVLLFPDAHWQDVNNPKFEGYNGESTVILNDMDNKCLRQFTVSKLKNLCDPQGTKCQVNYGCVHVQARMIVTSNYSLKECFQYKGKNAKFQPDFDETDVDYLALKRRFRVLTVDQFLFENNLQLVNKHKLSLAKTTRECFEPFDPERSDGDAYSECNGRTISSQTSTKRKLESIDESTQTDDTDEQPSKSIKCTFSACSAPGMWTGEGVHIHYK